jgi:hypothetical protein
MSEIERRVTVDIHTDDKTGMYETTPRGRASRTFPPAATPREIGLWVARTAVSQVRDAQSSYPLPTVEAAAAPIDLAAVIAKPADQVTAAESEAFDSTDDIPF